MQQVPDVPERAPSVSNQHMVDAITDPVSALDDKGGVAILTTLFRQLADPEAERFAGASGRRRLSKTAPPLLAHPAGGPEVTVAASHRGISLASNAGLLYALTGATGVAHAHPLAIAAQAHQAVRGLGS